MLRDLAELLQKCFTIRLTCELFKVLPHELIDTLTQSLRSSACTLNNFIIDR